MPRPPRFLLAGGHYHVLARGNLKQDIFLNDVDRLCWLGLLGEACQRHHWKCLAWVQMNNHYHLIVRTDEPTLSDGMHLLNGLYTRRFNFAHDRVGHVFQGRYKAFPIEDLRYLYEVCRYVMLNPVRAKLVLRSDEWRWSSVHAALGRRPAPSWLDLRWLGDGGPDALKSFLGEPSEAEESFMLSR